jgi:hypothetical protein
MQIVGFEAGFFQQFAPRGRDERFVGSIRNIPYQPAGNSMQFEFTGGRNCSTKTNWPSSVKGTITTMPLARVRSAYSQPLTRTNRKNFPWPIVSISINDVPQCQINRRLRQRA